MRNAKIERNTAETQINLTLEIDGKGVSDIHTDCGFLNHMLTLFARHGRFDLALNCNGDTDVDFHHSTEDIGIALGQAFAAALGEKRGIKRYGSMLLPMDEALVEIALDISGRACYVGNLILPTAKVGDFDTELVDEFLTAFCRNLGLTLHVFQRRGTNSHHIIEAVFKGLARAMREACMIESEFADEIPSTKGVL